MIPCLKLHRRCIRVSSAPPNRFMDGCGMQVPTFAVAASCADGYEGDANVEA